MIRKNINNIITIVIHKVGVNAIHKMHYVTTDPLYTHSKMIYPLHLDFLIFHRRTKDGNYSG